jgi:hypothetical protein
MGMKKTENQQGSMHLILVGVLAVVLLGALGWLFWQNILQKKPADSTSSTTITQTPTPKQSTNDNVLHFPKWSVEVVINSDEMTTKEYHFVDGESDYYYYDIVAKDGVLNGCYPETPTPISLGRVARYAADSKEEAFGWNDGTKTWREIAEGNKQAVLVDKYVYTFQVPPQACGDPKTSMGNESNKKQESLSILFRNSLQKMVQSSH